MGSNAKKTTFRLRVKDNRFLLLSSGFLLVTTCSCILINNKYSEVFFCCLHVGRPSNVSSSWSYFFPSEIQSDKKTLLLLLIVVVLIRFFSISSSSFFVHLFNKKRWMEEEWTEKLIYCQIKCEIHQKSTSHSASWVFLYDCQFKVATIRFKVLPASQNYLYHAIKIFLFFQQRN